MHRALILDFDRSVLPLRDSLSIDLSGWQPTLRYGCTLRDFRRFETFVAKSEVPRARVTLLGSGDFHHVTYALVRRLEHAGPFQVVVFDNHPDNTRYPWGIHCGSWVHHVCRLPFVSRVTVVGITSEDVGPRHVWENHLLPLYRGKLEYLCFAEGRRVGGFRVPGFVDFSAERPRLAEALRERIAAEHARIYLTIDKDVLAPSTIRTNWDQGTLREEELLGAVRALAPNVFAADVTGEISFFRYESWWKRRLARLDGQSLEPPADLAALHEAHRTLNERLLAALSDEG